MPATGMTGVHTEQQQMSIKVGNPIVQNIPNPTSFGTGPQTITAAQIASGIIVGDGTGGATYTLDTAANFAAYVAGLGTAETAKLGDTLECLIVNGGTGTITLAAGSGGGFDTNQAAGSRVIAANTSKLVMVRMSAVPPNTPAYVVYS